jgi:serine phosphatase RsbU (regulator of sigma subunit)
MYLRHTSAFFVVFLMAINSSSVIFGQSTDSLLYLLNNNLVEDDSAKYELLCEIIANTTDLESNLQYCDQAIELAEELNIMPAKPYILKGTCYLNSGNLALALECFIKAANNYEKYDYNEGLADAYQYIAETYNQQENRDNAKYYLKRAIKIYEKEKDSTRLATALLNLGYTNYSMDQFDSALVLFSTTSDLFKKLDKPIGYAYSLGNSGLAYSGLSDFEKAEEYLLPAIEILTQEGDERAVTEYVIKYASILQQKGEIKKAITCANRGFVKAIQNGIKEYERDAAQTLAQLYEITGMYDSAYHYQSLYISANDSIKSDENIQKMADLRTEFEVAKKQAEVEILEKNKLFQRIVILGLAIILFLAMGLVLIYYLNLKLSRKLTADLDERRLLLEKQSSELKEKNDRIIRANEELKQLYEITNSQKEEIISGINYAQRIQKAILPPEAYITELINENFILYRPKEIVSGDFYWLKQINQYIILVAADCTGHGVPGALMSMLGISYLNEIVQRKAITKANQVLNELRKEIKHSLRQTGKKEESRDGIDMAIIVFDTAKSLMQYSGAFIPLYIISNIERKPVFKEIKPDMMPVGVHFSGDISFTNHEIKLEIGDTLYLSTDGYTDQNGGSDNTRFGKKNFKKLLSEIHDQPLFEQKEILEQTLNEWMGKHPQRDDILVIGARL